MRRRTARGAPRGVRPRIPDGGDLWSTSAAGSPPRACAAWRPRGRSAPIPSPWRGAPTSRRRASRASSPPSSTPSTCATSSWSATTPGARCARSSRSITRPPRGARAHELRRVRALPAGPVQAPGRGRQGPGRAQGGPRPAAQRPRAALARRLRRALPPRRRPPRARLGATRARAARGARGPPPLHGGDRQGGHPRRRGAAARLRPSRAARLGGRTTRCSPAPTPSASPGSCPTRVSRSSRTAGPSR
jgi:hypothetical protein